MEGALVVGAVAEEADHHLAVLLHLGGESSTHGDRNTAGDDAVRAEVTGTHVGNMHGAATALAVARGLAEKLGEHAVDLRALGNAVAVATMGGGDLVIGLQGHADAHGARFLTDREMHRAVDQAAGIGVFRTFLEAADEMHLVQHVAQLLRAVGAKRVGHVFGGSLLHGLYHLSSLLTGRRPGGPGGRAVRRSSSWPERRCWRW